jgi:hypothetical protein
MTAATFLTSTNGCRYYRSSLWRPKWGKMIYFNVLRDLIAFFFFPLSKWFPQHQERGDNKNNWR